LPEPWLTTPSRTTSSPAGCFQAIDAAPSRRARAVAAARRSTSQPSTTLDDPPVTLMPSSRAILATTHCPAFAGVVSWPGSVSRGWKYGRPVTIVATLP
jgi:hypothetical protein